MSTPARAVRKLAEPLAVKKKLAADAKAGAILGRCICAVRRTRSIFRRSCRWRKGLNSAVRTKAARRSSLDWGAHAPRDCRTLAFLGKKRPFFDVFDHQNCLAKKQNDL